MSDWSLPQLFENLNKDINHSLSIVRSSFAHPGAKGDGSENTWVEFFNTYLPKRYCAAKAFVVDSNNQFSDQIDVVIFDKQYSPFIFHFKDQLIIPAESVYAIFETKQTINADHVRYAQEKVASVRMLHRTSLPIPHAGGTYPPKPLIKIIGGILTLDSDWKPALGKSLEDALNNNTSDGILNIGCATSHGYFKYDEASKLFEIEERDNTTTQFLFELISMLQLSGTVPMIDVSAYAKWLR